MQHHDHVNLIRQGITEKGGRWADLGSGHGAFTLALADLLGPTAHITSVDKDRQALRYQAEVMQARFPAVSVTYQTADFTQKLDFSALDGILLANSLHYVRNKGPVLDLLSSYLRPGGHLLLVEYNTDRGNPWVPYPVTYTAWEQLIQRHQFQSTRLLATVPSRFLHEMFAALSIRK